VNANAMKQVSEMVKDNPEQTVSVIRAWLQERK
jgi:flagellar biosynthesis/type III secretory pathway M-ring protein FliF/YscJ